MGEAQLISDSSMFKPCEKRSPPTLLGSWKTKSATAPTPVVLKSVLTKIPSSRPTQRPPQPRANSSSPSKRCVPVSSISTSPTLSSPRSLSSEAAVEAPDARLSQKKPHSGSLSARPSNTPQGASVPVKGHENASDASRASPLKRERPSGDASSLAEGSKTNEIRTRGTSLAPSPPKRAKKIKDASTREPTLGATFSAETSRASSPTSSVKSVASRTKTPHKSDEPGKATAPRKDAIESVPVARQAVASSPVSAPPPSSPVVTASPSTKPSAPVSTASTTSSSSSLTSLSSIITSDTPAPHPPPEILGRAEDTSKPSTLKRERLSDDASSFFEAPDNDESRDATPAPSPPKRAKNLQDALTRESSVSPFESAESSRASTPAPTVKKTSARSKKTSRKSDASGKPKRRRKKRALTDLTLPPLKGTYRGRLDPVTVRNVETPDSTTAYESDTNLPVHDPRQTWTEEDGNVGNKIRSSEQVVKRLSEMGRYITFFRNPNDPEDKSYELSEHPTVELEYPNTGAVETFLLARPKDEDHYDPTVDIENTLTTFVKDVIPEEYRGIFGSLPEDALRSIVDDDDDGDKSRGPSIPPESLPTFIASSLTFQTTETSPFGGVAYPDDSESGTPPPPSSSPECSPSPKKLMRTLASARHRKDGPRYTATLREINRCIRELKERASGNILRDVPRSWETDGIPVGVAHRIVEETYQRCVGPQITQLRKYEAFSSNVYGELTPAFVDDIIVRTRLNSKSLFVDLGSGVGNVVLQAALQTGCKAFGIEQRTDAAQIADDQLEQIKLRCRMWGVSMGEVELVQGDMITNDRVVELMSQADVVLVNNYVFSEELNAALRPKFLDLKEGAYVVSLKPYATSKSHLLTRRNFDEFSAIFDVHPVPYHSGTVSWSSGNGTYYIHHVNREKYRLHSERFRKNLEKLEEKENAKKRKSKRTEDESEVPDST